jgi:hypothetical protein
MDDGELGCSTRRWEERLTLSHRLYREARRHSDLAALLRQLAEAHEHSLPPAVWVGYELGTNVRSAELGTTLSAVSHCALSPPSWAPQLRKPTHGCRLYTFMAFEDEI